MNALIKQLLLKITKEQLFDLLEEVYDEESSCVEEFEVISVLKTKYLPECEQVQVEFLFKDGESINGSFVYLSFEDEEICCEF